MWGVPFAGKSTFVGLLAKVLDVFRVMYLDEQNLDGQLSYSKLKDLILIDDATTPTLFTLLRSRNILDGFPVVGNQKYKHRTTFVTPPIIMTTNEDMEFVENPPEGKTISDVVCLFLLVKKAARAEKSFWRAVADSTMVSVSYGGVYIKPSKARKERKRR